MVPVRALRCPGCNRPLAAAPARPPRSLARVLLLLALGAVAVAGVAVAVRPEIRTAIQSRAISARWDLGFEPLGAALPPARPASAPAPALPATLSAREIASGLDGVRDVAFLLDGRHLVSAGYGDYSVRVWDAARGEEVQGIRTHHRPEAVLSLPNGEVLVLDVYGLLRRFRPHPSGRLSWSRVASLEDGQGRQVALDPSGTLLAVTTVRSFAEKEASSTMAILRAHDLSVLRRVTVPLALRRPAFSASSRLLAAGSTGNTFVVWDLATGKAWLEVVPRVDARSDVGSVAFSPDERLLATGHMDSSITVWEVEARRLRHNFFVPDSSTWKVAFSPAGDLLVTAEQDGSIRLWDPVTAQPRGMLRGHQKGTRGVAFARDGRMASFAEDGRIVLWQAEGAPAGREGAPAPAASGTSEPSPTEILRLWMKIEAMEGVPPEQRQALRAALDRLPGMPPEERAALLAAMVALTSLDEMAREMGQALAGGLAPGGDDEALVEWHLAFVPEAAPLVHGLRALAGPADAAVWEKVFSRGARAQVEADGWTRAREGMQRLWQEQLGGATPGRLHVAFAGGPDRGVLHVTPAPRSLDRAPIPLSVSVPEIPVVREDDEWRIDAGPGGP